jgi:hypothetical protein
VGNKCRAGTVARGEWATKGGEMALKRGKKAKYCKMYLTEVGRFCEKRLNPT